MPSYTDEQKRRAVDMIEECGGSVTRAMRKLGYPTRQTLYHWLNRRDASHERRAGRPWSHYDPALKAQAVAFVRSGCLCQTGVVRHAVRRQPDRGVRRQDGQAQAQQGRKPSGQPCAAQHRHKQDARRREDLRIHSETRFRRKKQARGDAMLETLRRERGLSSLDVAGNVKLFAHFESQTRSEKRKDMARAVGMI